MNNMIPFQQANVPAFLANTGMTPEQVKAMNAAAAVGTGGAGLNKISLKQSRFRMVIGGQEQVIPSMDLDLVIVRVNDGISKTWYEKEWNPNEEAGMPECSSDDGISPRLDSPKRQSDLCQTCPRNQWGSKINRLTGEKGKECQDTKRMAIMPPGQDGRYTNADQDLFQLAVPPASLKDFGGFVRNLAGMPTPAAYNMVVATVSFDTTVTYPKILFKPKRWLEADEWNVVGPRYNEDETQRIAGIASAQTMRPSTPQLAGPAQNQQVQQQMQQQPQQQMQQQQVQQPAQEQQQAAAGWGNPQQVNQQPQQQAAAGWGNPQQVQQPQQQAQQPQQQAAAGWGNPQQVNQQLQPQEQAPQQQQQPQQQPQQQAPVQRERGKPSPGKARRTKAEIAEDEAADARDAAAAGGQTQQQPQQSQQQVDPNAAAGWGNPQPVQQQQPQQVQQQPNTDIAAGWGNQQQVQQPQETGAPNQPNVMQGNPAAAFQGWDD
uniref:Uncharacterized protein n=1 Tax=viral metagenome TaxID=1070528 RepID=A0A6M3M997_9ZZZZ